MRTQSWTCDGCGNSLEDKEIYRWLQLTEENKMQVRGETPLLPSGPLHFHSQTCLGLWAGRDRG